jgi:hypothetical protein
MLSKLQIVQSQRVLSRTLLPFVHTGNLGQGHNVVYDIRYIFLQLSHLHAFLLHLFSMQQPVLQCPQQLLAPPILLQTVLLHLLLAPLR